MLTKDKPEDVLNSSIQNKRWMSSMVLLAAGLMLIASSTFFAERYGHVSLVLVTYYVGFHPVQPQCHVPSVLQGLAGVDTSVEFIS